MHSRISKHECSPLQQVFPLKRHLPLSDAKRAACPGRDNLESAITKKNFHECSVLIFTIMSEKQLLRACFENKQLDFLCTCLQIDIKVTVVYGVTWLHVLHYSSVFVGVTTVFLILCVLYPTCITNMHCFI